MCVSQIMTHCLPIVQSNYVIHMARHHKCTVRPESCRLFIHTSHGKTDPFRFQKQLAQRALIGNKAIGGLLGMVTKKRGTQGEVLGGEAGEIAVREMVADITTDALSRYPNTLEKDRDIASQDPSKPSKGKKSKFAEEVMPPSAATGNDGAFPNADAWVGVFSEPVRQTQRSVAAARVRVSERRILAKTDSEVRLQLRKIKADMMTKSSKSQ